MEILLSEQTTMSIIVFWVWQPIGEELTKPTDAKRVLWWAVVAGRQRDCCSCWGPQTDRWPPPDRPAVSSLPLADHTLPLRLAKCKSQSNGPSVVTELFRYPVTSDRATQTTSTSLLLYLERGSGT